MNKKVKLFTTTLIVLISQFCLTGMATATIHPYIGAEATWRYQSILKNFGGNVVKHSFPQGGLFAGFKLNDFISIEGGYESTTEQRRNTRISNGSSLIFGILAPGENEFFSAARLFGWRADLIGTFPMCIGHENFNFMAYGGISYKTFYLKLYPSILVNERLSANDISDLTRKYRLSKYIARAGLGIQYMLTDCAGIRTLLGWENVSQFKDRRFGDAVIRLKDAFTASFGVFYNF